MNREYAQKALPLIQAAADGKIIQSRTKGHDKWHDTSDAHTKFAFDVADYRVKPKPVIVYTVFVKLKTNGKWMAYHSLNTREEADILAKQRATMYADTRVVEVSIEE